MNHSLKTKEMPEGERPLSEEFRITAIYWADKDAAANLLEETKNILLQELKTRFMAESEGKMSEAQAERLAKIDPAYKEHIASMCKARGEANRKKVQLKYIEMKFHEWQSANANARAERRMV